MQRPAPDLLKVEYRVTGPLAGLSIPPPADAPCARDELWRHTCFEVFLMAGAPAYVEWNLAPSGDWARYAFARYREHATSRDDGPQAAPTLRLERPASPDGRRPEPEALTLRACVPLDAPMHAAGSLQVAIAAVLEHAEGGLSYWALTHPAGRPDFHDPRSFVLCL